MPIRQEPLTIDDVPGISEGERVLKLNGPLVMSNLFDFQAKIRADQSHRLIVDFTNVPYVDSAGIGALVGAYVTHQKGGRTLALVGVNERVFNALKVTHVENFFRFFDTLDAAQKTLAS